VKLLLPLKTLALLNCIFVLAPPAGVKLPTPDAKVYDNYPVVVSIATTYV
jgi:hypothetical protein